MTWVEACLRQTPQKCISSLRLTKRCQKLQPCCYLHLTIKGYRGWLLTIEDQFKVALRPFVQRLLRDLTEIAHICTKLLKSPSVSGINIRREYQNEI